MKHFDLTLVEYDGCGREVCIAPLYMVQPGDVVETDFGRGRVLSTAFCTDTDDIYSLFAQAHKITPIQGKMVLFDYKEAKDGLPTE